MPKMEVGSLRAILDAEKQSALSAEHASKLSTERTQAMEYYLGVVKDMPAEEGHSKVVSHDVADTVDGLMPPLMEIFCGGDEVVRFEPVNQNDVEAAQQETEYVNHVFRQENPGFLILYTFIKDALLQKTGIVKIGWEEKEEETEECYYNLDDVTYAMLIADEDIEVIEHTEKSSTDDSPSITPETDRAYT